MDQTVPARVTGTAGISTMGAVAAVTGWAIPVAARSRSGAGGPTGAFPSVGGESRMRVTTRRGERAIRRGRDGPMRGSGPETAPGGPYWRL